MICICVINLKSIGNQMEQEFKCYDTLCYYANVYDFLLNQNKNLNNIKIYTKKDLKSNENNN